MALAHWTLTQPQTEIVFPGAASALVCAAKIDGHTMRYLRSGSGPDLILLHGLLGAAGNWLPSMERLAANSTVYAVDGLGIGESERVEGLDAGLAATADRVCSFMDAVGISRADICGTSHGGAVAMMCAARCPQRVRSLLLHAPANPFSNIADPLIHFYRSALGRWFAQYIPSMPRHLQNMALGRMYGDATRVREGAVDGYVDSLAVPGTIEHVLRILDGWFDSMRDLENALASLREIPTLLLWGTEDRAVSLESGDALKKCFDQAEMVVIPGAGHMPFEEVPGMFAEAVNDFLRRHDRSDPTSRKQSRLHLVLRRSSAETTLV